MMTTDPLTPNILAAMADMPHWKVDVPSAAPRATSAVFTTSAGTNTPDATDDNTAATSGYAHVIAICPRCRDDHPLEQCPQVKAIEYQEGSRTLIKRVEFHEPAHPLRVGTALEMGLIRLRSSVNTCPRCNGHGREPLYLPLATEPASWTTCGMCRGNGLVHVMPESATVTTASTKEE